MFRINVSLFLRNGQKPWRACRLGAMGNYDLGARPRQLFLVRVSSAQQSYFIAWKENATLLVVHAGFPRVTVPSVNEHPAGDASPPTCESIAADFARLHQLRPEDDQPEVWEVTDRIGYVHPRIYRPEIHLAKLETERPTVTTQGRHAETISGVAAAQLIFDDLDELLVAIEPMQGQLSVFGHKPRQLLLLACMEVDSALKSIAAANGSTVPRPNINHHSRLARPMRLGDWEVRLARSIEDLTCQPFENWSPQSAVLPWYAAYNNTKHGRETHLHEAQLEHVLNAVAAVFILLYAQFGVEISDRLRHRPFEIVRRPPWTPDECYVLSPFDDGPWQSRGCL